MEKVGRKNKLLIWILDGIAKIVANLVNHLGRYGEETDIDHPYQLFHFLINISLRKNTYFTFTDDYLLSEFNSIQFEIVQPFSLFRIFPSLLGMYFHYNK